MARGGGEETPGASSGSVHSGAGLGPAGVFRGPQAGQQARGSERRGRAVVPEDAAPRHLEARTRGTAHHPTPFRTPGQPRRAEFLFDSAAQGHHRREALPPTFPLSVAQRPAARAGFPPQRAPPPPRPGGGAVRARGRRALREQVGLLRARRWPHTPRHLPLVAHARR